MRLTERDYTFDEQVHRFTDLYRQTFTGLGTDEETPVLFSVREFEELFPGTFETVSQGNSFDQTGLSGQNDLLTHFTYRGDLLVDAEATFDRVNQLLAGTNQEREGGLRDNLVRADNSFREIEEETSALYLSLIHI